MTLCSSGLLEQSFEVDAPIEQVWTALIDVEKVAPCLPGAAITGHDALTAAHNQFQRRLCITMCVTGA